MLNKGTKTRKLLSLASNLIFGKFWLLYQKGLDIIFFNGCGSLSPGFYLLFLRRQNSTSWPPSKTCCINVFVPRPSYSPSAGSSPSSSTSCPDRPSSASFRYDTNLIIIFFSLPSSALWLFPTYTFTHVPLFQTLSDLEPSLTYITDMASKVRSSTTCIGWRKSFWKPHAFLMWCVALSVKVKSLICNISLSTLICSVQLEMF